MFKNVEFEKFHTFASIIAVKMRYIETKIICKLSKYIVKNQLKTGKFIRMWHG